MSTSYRDMLVDLNNLHSCNELYERPSFYEDAKYKNHNHEYHHEDIFVPASIAKSWNDQHFEERKKFSEDMSLIKDELKSNRDQLQQMFRYVDKMANAMTQMGVKFQSHDEKIADNEDSGKGQLNREQDNEKQVEKLTDDKDLKENRIVLIDELREQLDRKSSENKKLVSQIELKSKDLEKYELQFLKLKEAYQVTRKESKKSKLERDSLREELDTLKAQIRNEKEKLDEFNEALRGKESMLDNKSKLVQKLVDERDALTIECQRVSSAYSTLRTEYTKLRHSPQPSNQTDNDENGESTSSLFAKITELKTELDSKTKQVESLNDQLETIKKENSYVSVDLKSLEKDASISRFEDILKKNEQTFASYDNKINILEEDLKKANHERDELNHLLNKSNSSDSQIKRYTETISNLNEKVKCLSDRLTSAEEDYNTLLKDKEDLSSSLESAEKDKEKQLERVTALNAEMKALIDQRDIVEDECKRLRSILDKNEELFSRQLKASEQATHCFEKQIASLNRELKEAKNQMQLAETECNSLKARIDQKHSQLSSNELDAALDQLNSSEKECQRLRDLLKDNECLIASKDKVIEDIKKDYEEKLKNLNEELCLVHKQKSLSEDECDRLKNVLKEKKELLASNSETMEQTKIAYEEKISSLNQELQNAQNQKLSVDDECKKLNHLVTEQKEAISKNEVDRKEKDRLQVKYDQIVSKCNNLEEQIKNLNEEKAKLREENALLENKQSDIKDNKVELLDEIKTVKNALAEKEKLIVTLEMEKSVITNSAKIYQDQVEKLKAQIYESMKIQDEIEDLRSQFIKSKEKEREYLNIRNDIENEHDSKIQDLQRQIEKAKQEGSSSNSQDIERLKRQLNESEEKQAQYVKEKKISDNIIEKLTFELDETTRFHESAENEISEMEKVQFNLSEELMKVMKENEQLQSESREMFEKMKVIENENKSLKIEMEERTAFASSNQSHLSLNLNKDYIDVDDIPIPKRDWGENFMKENSKSFEHTSSSENSYDSCPSDDSLAHMTQSTLVEESDTNDVEKLPNAPIQCKNFKQAKVKKIKSGKKSRKVLPTTPVLGALRNTPPNSIGNTQAAQKDISSVDTSPQASNIELGGSPFGSFNKNLHGAVPLGNLSFGSASSTGNPRPELKELSPLRGRNNTLKDVTPISSKCHSIGDGVLSLSKTSLIGDNQKSVCFQEPKSLIEKNISNMSPSDQRQSAPLINDKQNSLKDIPSLVGKQSSLKDMPLLGGAQSSLKDLPSLGGKQSSLKDIPSLEKKKNSRVNKSLPGGKLRSEPSTGNQCSLKDLPSIGANQTNLGKNRKKVKSDSKQKGVFSEGDLLLLKAGLDSDDEDYPGQDPREKLPKQSYTLGLEFDINEELDGDEIDEELEYGDGDIDDLLGNLL